MTKMPLPVSGMLHSPNEASEDAYEGYLRCSCGCERFRIRHNGKPAGWLMELWNANPIRAQKGQPLVIAACCCGCGKAVTLHCSEKDERGWLLPVNPQMEELTLPKLHDQRVRLHVIYCWDDVPEMQDGQYVTSHSLFSLGALSDEKPKTIHVYEVNC